MKILLLLFFLITLQTEAEQVQKELDLALSNSCSVEGDSRGKTKVYAFGENHKAIPSQKRRGRFTYSLY